MLFEEGVQKGFYAKVSRLGEHWFELDLHFLSLGGGEIALGWWFEECLVPYLVNTEKLQNVKSISIVTGYGKTRTRGRRFGDDGMRKRCKAMLQFMNIQELPQPNAGRIHVDKESLIKEVNKNGGKVIFDLDGYTHWKESETTANTAPDTPQKIRARFKPQVVGSARPPFTRIENEHTSAEYRLENQKKRGFYVDDKPVASVFDDMDDVDVPEEVEQEDRRGSFRGGRDGEDSGRGGFRGGGGRGYGRGYRDRSEGGRGFGGDRSYGDNRSEGRGFHHAKSDYRDNDKGGRGFGDNRRVYNDDIVSDRTVSDRRGYGDKEVSHDRRSGGLGRGSWRSENPSNHYGPTAVKNEASLSTREENSREYVSGGKDSRYEDRGSRGPNPSRRFHSERQEEYHGAHDETDRRGSQYGSRANHADEVNADNPVVNDNFGRPQRSYDNDFGHGAGRRGDEEFAPSVGNRQGGSYSKESNYNSSGRSNYRTRQGDERANAFSNGSERTSANDRNAAQFDSTSSNGGYSEQQHETDQRKRGYDEPERRTSASRGYTLEPQSQKRRLS